MKLGQIILKIEEIGDIITTKDEQKIIIDLCRKHKSASLIIDNYKLFVTNEKSNKINEYVEFFKEMIEEPKQFPLMPWSSEKGIDKKEEVEPDIF